MEDPPPAGGSLLEEVGGVPPGYYGGVNTGDAQSLRASVHVAITRHHRQLPFSGKGNDTWATLEEADEDPDDAGRIVDVYRNVSYAKTKHDRPYNREHVWPKSYGFPDASGGNLAISDCHHLFLSDIGYNEARGNKPFRPCTTGCTKMPTADGSDANYVSHGSLPGAWQTWRGRRGDVARALFYMDVRYEGGNNPESGKWEPNLALTDDVALISGSQTGKNEKLAYMGLLSVLLQWNDEDPVDEREQRRNHAVYQRQENRNPFVDHPEWVACLYRNQC